MRNSVRWLVPLSVAGLVAGGVAVSSAQAGGSPSVPATTTQQLLARLAAHRETPLSGTVATHADLGLPSTSLGGSPHGTSGDPASLATRFLAGDSTLRVWSDGPTRSRVQLTDPMGEFDVVRNGPDLWTYSSKDDEVHHRTAPAGGLSGGPAGHAPLHAGDAQGMTPEAMASRALAAADPTTEITLGAPQTVAGRAAYTLAVTPRTTGTLVQRIEVAVDAETATPLRLQVFARGHSAAAIETGFTAVSFAKPDAKIFAFTPPAGAHVTQDDATPPAGTPGKPRIPGATGSARPTTIGTGWETVVSVPVAAMAAGAQRSPGSGPPAPGGSAPSGTGRPGPRGSGDPAAALAQLTTPVQGGRALSTSLFSVLVTDDGRMLAGAVPVSTLVADAKK